MPSECWQAGPGPAGGTRPDLQRPVFQEWLLSRSWDSLIDVEFGTKWYRISFVFRSQSLSAAVRAAGRVLPGVSVPGVGPGGDPGEKSGVVFRKKTLITFLNTSRFFFFISVSEIM